MARSLLNDRAIAPVFQLPGRAGVVFDTSDCRRKKNLVLFFLARPSAAFLLKVDEAAFLLRGQQAELAVVLFWSVPAVEAFCRDHRLTYPLLADEGGKVSGNFLASSPGEGAAALFIINRQGEVFFQQVVSTEADLPPFGDIVNGLMLVNCQQPGAEEVL